MKKRNPTAIKLGGWGAGQENNFFCGFPYLHTKVIHLCFLYFTNIANKIYISIIIIDIIYFYGGVRQGRLSRLSFL